MKLETFVRLDDAFPTFDLISIFAAAIKLGQNQNQIFILFKESFSIKITHVN